MTGWRQKASWMMLGLVAVAFLALVGRATYLQQYVGDRLAQAAASQQFLQKELPARRGYILDRRGRVLAGTRYLPDAFIDCSLIGEDSPPMGPSAPGFSRSAFFEQLAAAVNQDPTVLAARFTENPNRRFLEIGRALPDVEMDAVRLMDHPAIGWKDCPKRFYPQGSLLGQVIGIVGRDDVGLEGIEKEHNEFLSDVSGLRQMACGVNRRGVDYRGSFRPPQDGGSLILTIDAYIQAALEESLQAVADKFRPESAVGIVMDPYSGEILAMGCWPTFDPNEYQSYPNANRRNRAVTDPVEPGSVFKPFVASWALKNRVITPHEIIPVGNGVHYFGKRRVKDDHPKDKLDFAGILVQSSNIGMGIMAERLGAARVYDGLRAFGFGALTGVELPGESAGILPPLKEWTSYSTVSVAFGQELAITPLQLARAFCAMVNGGMLPTPRMIAARVMPDGRLEAAASRRPEPIRVLPKEIADYLRAEVLPQVVEDGAGGNLRLKTYTMLGKTGTGQVPYAGRRGYEPRAYMSSFLGAAPVGHPRLVALVMVRKPDPDVGYYGRQVAGPAVGAVLEKSLKYLGVPPDQPKSDKDKV